MRLCCKKYKKNNHLTFKGKILTPRLTEEQFIFPLTADPDDKGGKKENGEFASPENLKMHSSE